MRYVDDRRHWRLPLLGGAEMNRVKVPEWGYLTSLLYPLILGDSMSTSHDGGPAKFPPVASATDEYRVRTNLVAVWMSAAPISGEYTWNDEFRSNVSFVAARWTDPLGYQYLYPKESVRSNVSLVSARIATALVLYTEEGDMLKTNVGLKEVRWTT